MAKRSRVSVRVKDDDLAESFDEALELTGLGETQFVLAAIKALVDYVHEHGEITLPLAIVPKSKLPKKTGASSRETSQRRPPAGGRGAQGAESSHGVNKDEAEYGATPHVKK